MQWTDSQTFIQCDFVNSSMTQLKALVSNTCSRTSVNSLDTSPQHPFQLIVLIFVYIYIECVSKSPMICASKNDFKDVCLFHSHLGLLLPHDLILTMERFLSKTSIHNY